MGEGLKRARAAAKATRKPDDAEAVAKEAYDIYRSMKANDPRDPSWSELSRSDKARFEWMIRFDRMCRGTHQ